MTGFSFTKKVNASFVATLSGQAVKSIVHNEIFQSCRLHEFDSITASNVVKLTTTEAANSGGTKK